MLTEKQISEEALEYLKEYLDELEIEEEQLLEEIKAAIPLQIAVATLAARKAVVDTAISITEAVKKAIEKGDIPEEFVNPKGFVTEGLSKSDPRRTFQAVLRTAYGYGRYERAKRTEAPFLIYRTMQDARVRDSHRKINGLTLPLNDPAWQTFYPPNGHGCRCIVIPADREDVDELKRSGVQIQEKLPELATVEYKDRLTGETVRLPEVIQAGFEYGPQSGTEQVAALLDKSRRRLDKV